MEFPDENENRQRDFYISECPFLRVFVDNVAGLTADKWIGDLKSKSLKVGTLKEMLEIVGTEKIERGINAAMEESKSFSLFKKNYPQEDQRFMFMGIVAMGYELADMKGVYLFYGDIYEKLVLSDVLRNTYEGSMLTLDLLQLGTTWRQDAKDDVPPEFRNFTFDLD